jgi:hypothetical protein
MSTTCNTPAPSIFPDSLTPRQITILNRPQRLGADCFTKPYPHRLAELDHFRRASRYTDCSRCGKVRQCASSHFIRQIFKCGLRFCEDCAEMLADRLGARYQPALKLLMERAAPGSHFTYLEISHDIPRETSDIESVKITRAILDSWLTKVKATLAAALPDTPHWSYALGYTHESRFTVRVLALTNHLDACNLFPGSIIWKETPPMYRLASYFRDKLIAVWMPDSPIDRAEHEALFDGLRRLRGSRVMDLHKLSDEEDLSVEDPQNPTDNSSSKHQHPPGTCPECGGKFTHETAYMPIEDLPTTPEGFRKLDWRPIIPKES